MSVPKRQIFCADANVWLAAHPAESAMSVITSLPGVSELPNKGIDGWRDWFVDSAQQIIDWLSPEGVAIFFQSDIRHEGAWIDKSFLLAKAIERSQASLVWHKIVCRSPAGTITLGRPSYSHMLCVSKLLRPLPKRPGPDVIASAGKMPWPRAMGENACRVACRFLAEETSTKTVVDPFCGHGTALAMANQFGFDAIGIDLSAKRCRIAETQVLESEK